MTLTKAKCGMVSLAKLRLFTSLLNTHTASLRIQRLSSKTTKDMVRILNVAEKNDAAKSLSDVMSRGGYRKVIQIILPACPSKLGKM